MATLPQRRTWRYEMPVKKYFFLISHVSTLLYGALLYGSKMVSFVGSSKQRLQTLACFVNRGHSGIGGFGFRGCNGGQAATLVSQNATFESYIKSFNSHHTCKYSQTKFYSGPVCSEHATHSAKCHGDNHIIDRMQGTKPTQAPKWSSVCSKDTVCKSIMATQCFAF